MCSCIEKINHRFPSGKLLSQSQKKTRVNRFFIGKNILFCQNALLHSDLGRHQGQNSPVTTQSLDLTPSMAARWISPSINCRWHSYVTGSNKLLGTDLKPEQVNRY